MCEAGDSPSAKSSVNTAIKTTLIRAFTCPAAQLPMIIISRIISTCPRKSCHMLVFQELSRDPSSILPVLHWESIKILETNKVIFHFKWFSPLISICLSTRSKISPAGRASSLRNTHGDGVCPLEAGGQASLLGLQRAVFSLVSTSSPYKDASHTGLGPPEQPCFNLLPL